MSHRLLSLFTERIRQHEQGYLVPVPEREVTQGELHLGGTYKVAVIEDRKMSATTSETESASENDNDESDNPPVQEGDIQKVLIEDIGDEGDGLARLEDGYIVFVPDTDIGNRVTIKITGTSENFAFGEVFDDSAVE